MRESVSVLTEAVETCTSKTIAANGPSRLWRKMTGLERIFSTIHDREAGCGRVVFLARFSGPADEPAIERALSLVTQRCRHAFVRVVRGASGTYEFRLSPDHVLPPIQFQNVRHADHGCEVAIERGRETFPTGCEPSLRWVVLVSESDDSFQILGLAHHALFDAFSMALLLRRFLEVLGNPTVPDWDWPEPKLPRGRWSTAWKHYSISVPRTFRHERLKKQCLGLPRDKDQSGACVIHRWSAHETTALTRACREVGTTVTALLGVAGMQAVHSHSGHDASVVDLVIPVNLRRYLPDDVAEQTIGNVVIVKGLAVDFRKPVSLCEQSQIIATQLKDYLANQSPLRVYHSVNMLVPKRFELPARMPAIVSSNSMGRFEFPASRTGVQMLECGWFANGGTYMPVFSQSAATINHRLSITSYSVWIAPERVRILAAEVDRLLREFAGLPICEAATEPVAASS